MKKVILSFVFAFIVSLTGCTGILDSHQIETLRNWSFQYNEGTNDYSIFFGLFDANGRAISAGVDVDIRIVNDRNEEVYRVTKSVTSSDFDYYTSQVAGDQYLAEIRIPKDDINLGKSVTGTVYLTVYKANQVYFDEVNCSAYGLPVLDIKLDVNSLPVEINSNGYYGGTGSKIRIEKVSYTYESNYMPLMTITLYGQKTYGSSTSRFDMFSYKLFDSEGYMVNSGIVSLNSLSQGDKFKDDSIVVYDLVPGETYTLQFLAYS